MNIKDYISDKKPSLSKSSVNTYNSILCSLYKRVFGDGNIDVKNFDKSKEILKDLNPMPPNKRKTILSALVVITDNKDYRTKMLEDIKSYNADMSKQEKTEEQKESWIEKDDITGIYNDLSTATAHLYKKKDLSMTDMQEIQSYIILSLLGGIFIPPRRSKDFVDFKIKNIDIEKDNYMTKDKLIFNSYKTASTYGKQEIDLPKPLKAILTKWVKINPTDYLLFDVNEKQLSNVKLNQRLNKLFGKKVSVNQLRHTFLTDKYGDMIEKQNELTADMKQMGSSRLQEKTYIKKEVPEAPVVKVVKVKEVVPSWDNPTYEGHFENNFIPSFLNKYPEIRDLHKVLKEAIKNKKITDKVGIKLMDSFMDHDGEHTKPNQKILDKLNVN